MKKVLIKSAGSYDRLIIEHYPTLPLPQHGEVLVKVHAVGVNYADVCVRMGVYESAKKYVGWPITPGFEFSGVILKLGENINNNYPSNHKKNLQVNSLVFGVTRFGAYSTHICVPSHQVFEIPSGISLEEAAAIPSVWLTAYYGLIELSHPRLNQTILVHSAAGGVGNCLVQLGKVAQCKVIGVVGSSHKVDIVKNLGADHVIDKSTENLWEKAKEYSPEGYSIILDANGVSTLSESYNHLNSGGKLVVYGFHSMLPKTGGALTLWHLPKLIWDYFLTPSFSPLKMTGQNKSVLCYNLSYMFDQIPLFLEIMDNILDLITEGKVKVIPVKTYPFEKVAQAHRDIESGNTIGKLVLIINDQ